jgi:hypothetical protein
MPALIPITYICQDCASAVTRKRNKRCKNCLYKSRKDKLISEKCRETLFVKGLKPWNKGEKLSLNMKSKISQSKKGKTWTDRQRENIVPNLRRGENHPNWIVDRTKLATKQERNDSRYKDWRSEVYKKDGFVCKINNDDCEGRIIAHHILGWASYPELRYEVNNGITLCQAHHPKSRAKEILLAPKFKELVIVSRKK